MTFGFVLLLVFMAGVVIALFTGLTLMMKGGEANKKYGNKLMVARVVCQGLAIATILVLAMMKGKTG